MRILMGGASGLMGRALAARLAAGGHSIVRLVRGGASGSGEIGWEPGAGRIDAAGVSDAAPEAAIHLSGENIASGRWTAARKARIRASRVDSTRLLAETLAGPARPPRALLVASAVGFYGDRGDELLEETSAPGTGFLAELCQAWEAAADPARRAGIRVVHLRMGLVASRAGGGLAKMLPPFRLGLGGPVGSGRQYLPWIAIDDALAAFEHVLMSDALAGPVNVVSPEPIRQREFARTLGRALHRPAMVPLPAFAARVALGEMAGPLLLHSARVVPKRLLESGFEFRYGRLDDALAHLLGRGGPA
jgi:hypothetical protein